MKEFFQKLGKKILLFLAPWLLLFIVILFVVGNMLDLFQSFVNAISGAVVWAKNGWDGIVSGIESFWDGTDDPTKYEIEAMDEWNGKEADPKDPYMTAVVYQTMKNQKDRMDEGTAASNGMEEAWDQFNSSDHTMMSYEDTRKFLKHAKTNTDAMFEKTDIYYEYKLWTLVANEAVEGESQSYHWELDYPTTDTTSDGLYKLVSRTKVEGEGDGSHRIFAPVWQDYLALGGLVAFDRGRNEDDMINSGSLWGTGTGSDATDYDFGKKEDATDVDAASMNSLENYFLTGKERKKIQNVFDYKFIYKEDGWDGWDGVKEGRRRNSSATRFTYNREEDKLNSGSEIGYRFRYKPDPEDPDAVIYDADLEGGYTMYIPEQAPAFISNSWKAYEYKYIPTMDVPADLGGWEGREAPPEGDYCAGRWVYENPAGLIYSISELAPYYEELSADEYWLEHHNTNTKAGETEGYTWEIEMMDQFFMYLDTLSIPTDSNGVGIASRQGYYQGILDDYLDKKLTIKYEGSSYNPIQMMRDCEDIKEGLLNNVEELFKKHYMKIGKEEEEAAELAAAERERWAARVEISYDTGAPFIKVDDDAGNIPFPSYGVIYGRPSSGAGTGEGHTYNPWEPVNYEYGETGSFYIYSHTDKGVTYTPDRWFTYFEGAVVDLRMAPGDDRYDKEQLRSALLYIQDKSGGAIPFAEESSVNAIYEYGQNNRVDMMGILAIILTEGGYTGNNAKVHYNFFNIKAGSNQPFFTNVTGGAHWRDFKAECGTPGAALVAQTKWVAERYINADQPNYLLMSFNHYADNGGPQSREEAIVADSNPGYSNCFCPWWDSAYKSPDWIDQNEWANQCGTNYLSLRSLAGITSIPGSTTDPGTAADYQIPPDVLSQYSILDIARQFMGTPYHHGGYSPAAFDCSGFVIWCMNHTPGMNSVPRTSAETMRKDSTVAVSDPRPGDIVFFERTTDKGPGHASHVGIYVGDGNFIHCSSSKNNGGVKISSLSTPYYRDHFMTFARVK